MADTRDFLNASDDIATAFAQYLMRATVASTHAMHLYEQVIKCVARRQISPDTLRQSLLRIAMTRAHSSQTNVAAAAGRFVESIATHNVTDTTFYAELAALAAGTKTPGDFRRATNKQFNNTLASALSSGANAWFELLGTLDEERGKFAEEYLVDVLRRANPIGFDGDVVELSGPIDSELSTTLTLDNTLTKRAVIHCGVSDVRRADGVGPAFIPALVFAPEEVIVEGANDAQLSVSLWLDSALYETQSPYVGSLHISRDDAPRLDIPLRITPTPSFSPS
ncbi:MAG TPA: hypothetical protein VGM50_22550 [Gemmatimonadaceae bacterium]|jgi:hypothetical protein